jgi:hypothetical protein
MCNKIVWLLLIPVDPGHKRRLGTTEVRAALSSFEFLLLSPVYVSSLFTDFPTHCFVDRLEEELAALAEKKDLAALKECMDRAQSAGISTHSANKVLPVVSRVCLNACVAMPVVLLDLT